MDSTSATAADAEVDLSYRWKRRAAAEGLSTTASGATAAAILGTKRKADQYVAGQDLVMADCLWWWMRLFFFAGCLAQGDTTSTPSDRYTQVKFAKTATLWGVKGFLNVESPVDISLFDTSCRQMEALLRTKRTAHSEMQRKMFHTTSLLARRVCATIEDWPHLFSGMQRTEGTHSGSSKRAKRQLLFGAALDTFFGGILWNGISDWAQDTTATDTIKRLQEDMAVLRNYRAVFAANIRTRFDKEFIIQAVNTELGSHITR